MCTLHCMYYYQILAVQRTHPTVQGRHCSLGRVTWWLNGAGSGENAMSPLSVVISRNSVSHRRIFSEAAGNNGRFVVPSTFVEPERAEQTM